MKMKYEICVGRRTVLDYVGSLEGAKKFADDMVRTMGLAGHICIVEVENDMAVAYKKYCASESKYYPWTR